MGVRRRSRQAVPPMWTITHEWVGMRTLRVFDGVEYGGSITKWLCQAQGDEASHTMHHFGILLANVISKLKNAKKIRATFN